MININNLHDILQQGTRDCFWKRPLPGCLSDYCCSCCCCCCCCFYCCCWCFRLPPVRESGLRNDLHIRINEHEAIKRTRPHFTTTKSSRNETIQTIRCENLFDPVARLSHTGQQGQKAHFWELKHECFNLIPTPIDILCILPSERLS